jgi:hypothetical protein
VGKKRRVLYKSKFAKLRAHPKYAGMVASNKKGKKEFHEEDTEQLIEGIKIVKEVEIVEATPGPKVIKLEKPELDPKKKTVPEMKAKPKATKKKLVKTKKTTRKKK